MQFKNGGYQQLAQTAQDEDPVSGKSPKREAVIVPVASSPSRRMHGKDITIVILVVAVAILSAVNMLLLTSRTSNTCDGLSPSFKSATPGYSTWGSRRPLVNKIEGYRNPIYMSENKTESDEAWASVNVGHGVVVLDTDYAMGTLGLPRGFDWPLDDQKSTYIIAAYHAMHCIALVRGALIAGFTGNMTKHQREHSLHCVDTLREETMCTADRTVLVPGPPGHAGSGLVRTCTDWTQLREWATKYSAGYMRAENGSEILNIYYPGTDGWRFQTNSTA